MAIATIAAVGVAVSAAGTYMNYQGQQKQAEAQSAALAEQQQIEAQRQRQMELDAQRRRNQLVRQSLAAHSMATAVAGAQGAAGAGSSALGGAYGGISGQSNTNELGINQNEEIGNNIFAANTAMLGDYRAAAGAGSYAALGSGLSSLGGTLMRNDTQIAKVGSAFGNLFSGA